MSNCHCLSYIYFSTFFFYFRHGKIKNIISSLQNRLIYIVHENIEVSHPGEPAVYSIVTDAPIYKMEIDFSAHSNYCPIGYCYLRNSEVITKAINDNTINETIEEIDSSEDDDDDLKTEKQSFLKTKSRDSMLLHLKSRNLNTNVPIAFESNSVTSSESDYVYAISMNHHQPLKKISKNSILISSNSLPETCLTKTYVSSELFLSSKVFLINFLRIFHKKLGCLLNLSNDEVEHATWMSASIYGNNWQVTPSIACPWLKEAFEWIHRHREIIENPTTKQKFQWPNREIVGKVISFGCHVIPLHSYHTKITQKQEIEWKIIFPDAERYLESCLTSTQIKVFIIVIALIKTHVEPHIDSKTNHLTAEHLRCLLFWQCERNCAAWPEDYLGEALMRYLQSLLRNLKKQKLPDYFLPERNLFENISKEVLVDLHRRIYRIIENPTVNLIAALRNLKFKQTMLPLLNFRKIYATITIDNPLKIINPIFRTVNDKLNGIDNDIDQIYFEGKQNPNISNKKLRRVAFIDDKNFMKNENRKDSIETIDIQLVPAQHTNQLRRVILFEIFAKHFIDMSQSSLEHCSWNLSLIYLEHAARLCSLLAEDGCKANSEVFLSQIKDIHRSVMENINHDAAKNRPRLPQRQNSLKVDIHMHGKYETDNLQFSPLAHKFNCVNFYEEENVPSEKEDVTKL